MRDYQAKCAYTIEPRSLYLRVLALVRDYPSMLRRRDALLAGDGEDAAFEQLWALMEDIDAVEHALEEIPEEYREGILQNVVEGVRMLDLPYAGERTWGRQKAKFLWNVAANKRWV